MVVCLWLLFFETLLIAFGGSLIDHLVSSNWLLCGLCNLIVIAFRFRYYIKSLFRTTQR